MSKIDRVIDRVVAELAWHFPRRLVLWAAVRLMVHATTGKYASQNVSKLRAIDALWRW